ncbi:MAG: MlaD family protein [Sediminibacterium sp.]|nr:MlaD family protein [Sediminibacterium sp.]TXT34829.1 MAG: hypothetical protein FD136_93 [Chitinophagaceae bacterium]
MKPTVEQKTKTGIFVIAGLLLLIAAIFFIGKQKNLFDKTFTIYTKFGNVSGLQSGNYVRLAGINIGTVTDIEIINDSTVKVSLQIEENVKKFIKNDAIVRIGSDGIMGDKLLQISPGDNNSKMIKDGAFIKGINPVEMTDVMIKMTAIADNAELLTKNLADIVHKVNDGQGSLGRLLNSDKLAKNLEKTISSSQETVKSIKKSADGFSENMEAAKSNILLRGYFRKKEKKRIEDSTNKAKLLKSKKTPKN